MDASQFVFEAKEMAARLEEREVAIHGAIQKAREILAAATGIPESIFYGLRHRPPKTIDTSLYCRLCEAIEARAIFHVKALEHDIFTSRARRNRINSRHLLEAETAARTARELLNRRTP
jgi:hypothetical protein